MTFGVCLRKMSGVEKELASLTFKVNFGVLSTKPTNTGAQETILENNRTPIYGQKSWI